ncbi:MAG: FAD-dependent oxidoreductase [Alphaproteobacteria bacterium]|nr:FAD-dependent oxidoreductase [Alphaproteobacteria bacterium]
MTVHVVGAGLAGLAAAIDAAGRGRSVRVHEAAGQAGGRCRSFFDATLGRTIDNGNHLLLSGNRAALAFLDAVGARDALTAPAAAVYPFVDLASGARWHLAVGDGVLPLWILDPARRVPGTRAADYWALVRLACAGPGTRVDDVVPPSHPLHRALVAPLAVAALNAGTGEGAAALLAPVMRETFARGGAACRPLIARRGLDDAFAAPALHWLAARGIVPRFNARLRGMRFRDGRVAGLRFADGEVAVAADDAVVLAVPPAIAAELVPDLTVPEGTRAILNAHFRLPERLAADGEPSFLGILGGTAEWLFMRGDVASVTVSAADALIDRPADDLAAAIWADVARALSLAGDVPPWRIVKEKRATFAQTPEQVARRPPAATAWPNLFLAGDWTATGLPATIEGAIRSGFHAASLACGVENGRDRRARAAA